MCVSGYNLAGNLLDQLQLHIHGKCSPNRGETRPLTILNLCVSGYQFSLPWSRLFIFYFFKVILRFSRICRIASVCDYSSFTWLPEGLSTSYAVSCVELFSPPPPPPQPRPQPSSWKKLEEYKEYKSCNTLREYQLEGVNWLLFNWYNRY